MHGRLNPGLAENYILTIYRQNIILRLRSVTDALEMFEMNRAANAASRESGKSTDGKIIPQLFLEIVRPVVVRVRPTVLKLVNQITDANAKSFGNSQKRVQANPLLSAFDFADINRMQVGFFCQFFLAHADMLPAIPNGVTQDFQLSRTRHSFLAKHECAETRTPNMGLF